MISDFYGFVLDSKDEPDADLMDLMPFTREQMHRVASEVADQEEVA